MQLKFLFGIVTFVIGTSLYSQVLELVTFEYPPYEYTQNRKVKGLAVDIVKLIFKEMNQSITIEVLPWAKAIQYIKEGKKDAVFTAFKNLKRVKFADYSQALIPQVVSLFVKKDSPVSYNGNLYKLSKYSIGVVKKVSYGERLDNAISANVFRRVDVVNDGRYNFRRLLNGRVDIVASNRDGALHILNQLGKVDEIVELSPKLQMVPSYIAFSKKRNLTHIRDKFDSILKRIKKDGTYSRILKFYFTK